MKSIRSRLVLWNALGITLFLGASGFVIYEVVRERVERERDATLLAVARSQADSIPPALGRRLAGGETWSELMEEVDWLEPEGLCWF